MRSGYVVTAAVKVNRLKKEMCKIFCNKAQKNYNLRPKYVPKLFYIKRITEANNTQRHCLKKNGKKLTLQSILVTCFPSTSFFSLLPSKLME